MGLSLDVGLYNAYVWRGLQFNEEGVVQTSLDYSYGTEDLGSFGLKIWGNIDLDNEGDDSGEFSEVDYTAYWVKSFDTLILGGGVIVYDFPSKKHVSSTKEVYLSVGIDMVLAPTVTAYYDFDSVEGFYLDFGVSQSIGFLDLAANIGWADDNMTDSYYDEDAESGFTNYSLSASIDFELCDSVTLTPSLAYYGLLEDAQEDLHLEDDEFILGLNLNITF